MTGGLVAQQKFAILPGITPLHTAVITITTMLVCESSDLDFCIITCLKGFFVIWFSMVSIQFFPYYHTFLHSPTLFLFSLPQIRFLLLCFVACITKSLVQPTESATFHTWVNVMCIFIVYFRLPRSWESCNDDSYTINVSELFL